MPLSTRPICCLQDAEHGEVINGAFGVPLTELAMDLTAVLTLLSTFLPTTLRRDTELEDEDLEDGDLEDGMKMRRTHWAFKSFVETPFCQDH